MNIELIEGKTKILTYPQVELKENLPVGTRIVEWKKINFGRKVKMTLLEVNGYEMRYFQVNDNDHELILREEIDREEFLDQKRCFDRKYCLIELHFLINDGEEYAVLPLHIVE